MSKLQLLLAVIFVIGLRTTRSALAADMVIQPVALSGTAGVNFGYGPGVGGNLSFLTLGTPAINSQGKVAFRATLLGSIGLWTSSGGAPNVVARTGASGPGPNVGGNVTFSGVGDPYLDAAGNIAFTGFLAGNGINSTNNRGIWSNTTGAISALFRAGASGPGPEIGAGITFDDVISLATEPARFSGSGHLTSLGRVVGPGIDATNNIGYWLSFNGVRTNIARIGTGHNAGPNLGSGVAFRVIVAPASVNSAGDVVFFADLTGPGIDSTNRQGFWRYSGGALQLLARTGPDGPGPNLGPDLTFGSLMVDEHSGEGFSKEVTFIGSLSGPGVDASNRSGIWASSNGTLRPVARAGTDGQLGPGLAPGVRFGQLIHNPTSLVINAAGNVAFTAPLVGNGITAANNTGLWTEKNSALTLIAQRGQPSPTGASTFAGFLHPSMNAAGEVAFLATLANGAMGLYFWNDDALIEVVRTGTSFDVNPDPLVQDLRTIREIDFAGSTSNIANTFNYSGGDDGRRSMLSENGTLVFGLTFSNGPVPSGIYTATPVPEPSGILLFAIGGLLFSGVRRSGFSKVHADKRQLTHFAE